MPNCNKILFFYPFSLTSRPWERGVWPQGSDSHPEKPRPEPGAGSRAAEPEQGEEEAQGLAVAAVLGVRARHQEAGGQASGPGKSSVAQVLGAWQHCQG